MPLGSAVPLGALADVRVVTGPPMIKDEGGVLTGYVFADIDGSKRDIGGWVKDAKRLVAERVALPAGYRLAFTGQYEFMAEMEARLRVVLPITLLLITGAHLPGAARVGADAAGSSQPSVRRGRQHLAVCGARATICRRPPGWGSSPWRAWPHRPASS